MQARVSLVVLRTRDLERTLAFYRALGLTFVQEKHGSGPAHFSSTLSGTVVEVYPARTDPEPDRRAPGATMVGFAVESLNGALEALRGLGARVLTEPKDGTARRAVVEDPDARAVEITQEAWTCPVEGLPSRLGDLIDEIKKLPHEHRFTSHKCGSTVTARTLDIYAACPSCKEDHKTRAFGSIGTEIHDVVDAVLEWMGSGATLEAVMDRKRVIDSAPASERDP